MTGNRAIYIHSGRQGRSKHHTKHKASKQSDDYHDGHLKHADRTAKFTHFLTVCEFGCFCFLCFVKHSRAPPNAFVQF